MLSNFILKRSLFFFTRMLFSEQSTFHGQASDRVWSFRIALLKRRGEKNRERCKGVHCVDIGESLPTHIFLQNLASIQPRTSLVKFACSPRTDPPGAQRADAQRMDGGGFIRYEAVSVRLNLILRSQKIN